MVSQANHMEPLDDRGVELYWADVEAIREAEQGEADAMLSVEERKRLNRFRHEPSRRCYLATRRLVRTTLSTIGGRPPQKWRFGVGGHGRPYLENPTVELRDIDFNLAHSRHRVVLAICAEGRVGVDLEPVSRRVDHDVVARRFFHDREKQALQKLDGARRRRRFLQLWVLKEAWMKADGRGIGAGLSEVVFDFDRSGRPNLVAVPDGDVASWTVVVDDVDDHLLAVAYTSR